MKKRVLTIITMLLSVFLITMLTTNKVNAATEDLNIRYAVDLFWSNSDQVSTGSEYHLVADEFDGNFFTIPMIADYSLTATMGNISAFNAVRAIFPGHSEAFAYFVFMVDLEELHFYNHRLQYKAKVPFDEVVTIISTSDDPHKDYNDGFVDGYGHGQTSGYNNGYQEGKSDGIDIGYIDGFNEGELKGYDEGYNDSNFYNYEKYVNEKIKVVHGDNIVYLDINKKYSFYGNRSSSIIRDIDENIVLSNQPSGTSVSFDSEINIYYGFKNTFDNFSSKKITRMYPTYRNSSIVQNTYEFYNGETLVMHYEGNYNVVSTLYFYLDLPDLYRVDLKVDNITYFRSYYFTNVINLPKDPYKKNQYFMGWYEEESEEPYNFNEELTENIVLYAVFGSPNTITFNSNGGNNIPSLNEIAGAEINPPDNPIKSGYEFIGWYSDLNFEEEFEFDLMPDDDITLYAKWEANEYTIEFYLGEELYSTKTVIGNENVILPATPNKENQIFLGWYYDQEFNEQFKVTDEINDDVTLYGKFGAESSGGDGSEELPPDTPSDGIKWKKEYIAYITLGAVTLILVGIALATPKTKKKRK